MAGIYQRQDGVFSSKFNDQGSLQSNLMWQKQLIEH